MQADLGRALHGPAGVGGARESEGDVPPQPARDRAVGIHLRPGWQRLVPAAWLEGWKPQRFDVEGGWTEVVTMGAGPPLVLLPPLPGYKEAWIACAGKLAREFRVITFDLRNRFQGQPSWEALL